MGINNLFWNDNQWYLKWWSMISEVMVNDIWSDGQIIYTKQWTVISLSLEREKKIHLNHIEKFSNEILHTIIFFS